MQHNLASAVEHRALCTLINTSASLEDPPAHTVLNSMVLPKTVGTASLHQAQVDAAILEQHGTERELISS